MRGEGGEWRAPEVVGTGVTGTGLIISLVITSRSLKRNRYRSKKKNKLEMRLRARERERERERERVTSYFLATVLPQHSSFHKQPPFLVCSKPLISIY